MKFKTVVFDMDGTILNTLEDLKNSVNVALKAEGFPERSLDEIRGFVGNGIRLLMERSVPKNTPADITDRCFEVFKEHYSANSMVFTAPYDGIREVISKLREAGIKTAVVSNKADAAVHPLCEHFFKGLFDCAIGERPGQRKKPAPDAVFAALKELGAETGSAVYVGDSDVDVATAKNSSLPCIACLWGFRGRDIIEPLKPEFIIEKPVELLNILL